MAELATGLGGVASRAGVLTLGAGVPPEHVDDAAEDAHRLLDDLGDKGIDEDEFKRARERAVGRLALEMDINFAHAWHVLEHILFTGPGTAAPGPGALVDRIAAVTHDQVSDLAADVARSARATAIVEAAPA